MRGAVKIDAMWMDPGRFASALAGVEPASRDAWLDRALGIGELPDDGPALPRDCVPYLPCSASVLLRVAEHVSADDVVVDVGAGAGRAAAAIALLTGARVIGLEIQPHLVRAARELAERLALMRTAFVEADATSVAPIASVFFLYCPYGGRRLSRWLDALEPTARAKPIRILCVDLRLPPRPWLTESIDGELAIYTGHAL